jgi:two-component system phosphate regulon sensor histidine kinase PhoR
MTMGQRGEGDEDRGGRDSPAVGDFYAVVLALAAHDLRQPLQIMMSAHEWLERSLTGDPEREYLRRAGVAIAQLSGQLDSLVDMLRLYERRVSIKQVAVPLAPIFSGLVHDNIDAARRKGIELRSCRTCLRVKSDATLLAAVLRNLIHNALKYTRPGGRILLGCRRRGAEVSIEVHDTGVGIPADQLSKIFGAFHRLDSTRSDGLGLGLFVVRSIVNLLEHNIEVHSQLGHGSCFAVRLGPTPDAGRQVSPSSLRSRCRRVDCHQ